jgi:O-antigen/teichoic acid export membrane protein
MDHTAPLFCPGCGWTTVSFSPGITAHHTFRNCPNLRWDARSPRRVNESKLLHPSPHLHSLSDRLPTPNNLMPGATRLKSLFESQLRRNVATGVGTACVNVLLGLGAYPIYLHYLGYEQYGVWLALSTILTFAQLGNFGINPAVTKLVAEAHGARDVPGVQRYATTAMLAVSASGAIVFSAVLVLRRFILLAFNVSGSNARVMSELVPYIALFSVYIFLVECLNATLVGLGRMDLENYFRTISQAVALVCSALLLHNGYGVQSLLLGNVVAYLAMNALSLYAIRALTGQRLLSINGFKFSDLSRILNLGGWVFGGSVVNMALSPVNRIVLTRYAGIAALPIYEIAFSSSMRVRNLLESGFRAVMPEISRSSGSVTQETLRRAALLERKGFRIMAGFGGTLYAAVILVATPLLRFWLRNQYQAALPSALRIMLLGSFFSMLCVPGYYILLGLGKAKICFTFFVIQGAASLGVISLIILTTGTVSVTGVSLGVMVGMGLCSAYVLWKVKQITSDSPEVNFSVTECQTQSDGPPRVGMETELDLRTESL